MAFDGVDPVSTHLLLGSFRVGLRASRLKLAMFLFALCVVIGGARPLGAVVIPPNLPAGSQYQLIFVTSASQDAPSASVAFYNAMVNAQALLSPTLPDVAWSAVVSTGLVDARDNAPSLGLPIYNTQGMLVATASMGLYTNHLLNPVEFDQFGHRADSLVWTGSDTDGTSLFFRHVGAEFVGIGDSSHRDDDWIQFATADDSLCLHLYALSAPITVPQRVPEPSTLVLLATGALSLAACARRRKRARR